MFGRSKSKAWKKLESIHHKFKDVEMRDLFLKEVSSSYDKVMP